MDDRREHLQAEGHGLFKESLDRGYAETNDEDSLIVHSDLTKVYQLFLFLKDDDKVDRQLGLPLEIPTFDSTTSHTLKLASV